MATTTREKPAKAKGSEKEPEKHKLLAANPLASHLYFFLERFEAGIELLGTEVKAAREGRVSLRDAFVNIQDGQAFLLNCHIGSYSHQGYASHEALRPRRLLLHKQEIRKLHGKLTLKGLTVVPLRCYAKKGKLKLELALAEGKKLHDKRATLREREMDRDVRRALKEH